MLTSPVYLSIHRWQTASELQTQNQGESNIAERNSRHVQVAIEEGKIQCIERKHSGVGNGREHCGFFDCEHRVAKTPPFCGAGSNFCNLGCRAAPQTNLGFNEFPLHSREFQFIAANNHTLETVAAFKSDEFKLSGPTDLERVDGIWASSDFFNVLGIALQSGRTFLHVEDYPGSEHLVVIRHSLRRRRFGNDPTLVGNTFALNSEKLYGDRDPARGNLVSTWS